MTGADERIMWSLVFTLIPEELRANDRGIEEEGEKMELHLSK